MERQLRRIKDAPYPKAPKTDVDIRKAFQDKRVMSDYGFNLNKTKPIYIDTVTNGNHCFCLFASLSTIKIIEEKIPAGRNYSMDATFSIVPNGCFKQLLIIYIESRGDVNIFYFILLTELVAQFIIIIEYWSLCRSILYFLY